MASNFDLSLYKPDELYFFQDVYFSVSGVLFKLPKHHFYDNSVHFQEMFGEDSQATPMSPTATSPGGTLISKIYHITDASLDEFRQFLQILCPRPFGDENMSLTPPQWLTVLKLATQWQFENVRKIAIRPLDEVFTKKVKNGWRLFGLSRRYEVSHWKKLALHALAEKNLLDEEAKVKKAFKDDVGDDNFVRMVRFQSLTEGSRIQKGGSLTEGEISELIERAFPDPVVG